MEMINSIHSKIMSDYAKMQSDHETQKLEAKQMLYYRFPRIEQIDSEIAALAVNAARKVLEENISPEEAEKFVKMSADSLNKERQAILDLNGIKPYEIEYNCKKCKDTGFRSDGSKCGCYMKKLQSYIRLPGESGKNASLKKSSFDKFELSYYSKDKDPQIGYSPYDLMKINFMRCKKYCDEFSGNGSGNLFLYGPSGLGKTFMAGCIDNAVTDRGYFVIYKSAYKLLQFLEEYKFSKVDRDEYSIAYDSIYNCDLLIIDDFGTEFITSYTQSVFFDLINTRISDEKPIIINTNLTLDKINEIYQERIMSRLKNEFSPVRFAGADIREIVNADKGV